MSQSWDIAAKKPMVSSSIEETQALVSSLILPWLDTFGSATTASSCTSYKRESIETRTYSEGVSEGDGGLEA